jgi:preprotein translocase subunit SecA
LRRKVLGQDKLDDDLTDMIDNVVGQLVDTFGPGKKGDAFDRTVLDENFFGQFGIHLRLPEDQDFSPEDVGQAMYDAVVKHLDDKRKQYTPEVMEQATRFFMLQTLDDLWKDHLLTMDHLREGIGLRGYGQKDPKQEYKKEGFGLFQAMMFRFYEQTVERVSKVRIEREEEVAIKGDEDKNIVMSHGDTPPKKVQALRGNDPKTGRNDLCFCGSGKKFKKCHGKESAA